MISVRAALYLLTACLFFVLLASLGSGCTHAKPMKYPNPMVPNKFEQCIQICRDEGEGLPKIAVETNDTFRCFCFPKEHDT